MAQSTPSANVSDLVTKLIHRCLPTALLFISAICAGQETRVVRIGVDKTSLGEKKQSENAGEEWKQLQAFLNDQLVRVDSGLSIEFVPESRDNLLLRLLAPEESDNLDGAILSPLRYVLLDMYRDNVTLIAKLRRGNTRTSQKEKWDPTDDFDGNFEPSNDYRSVILRIKNERKPKENQKEVNFLSLGSGRSTSGDLYPFAEMHGEIDFYKENVHLVDAKSASRVFRPTLKTLEKDLRNLKAKGAVDRSNALERLSDFLKTARETKGPGSVVDHTNPNCFATADVWYRLLDSIYGSEAVSKIHTSKEPIPFDPVVAVGLNDRDIAALTSAFTSTNGFSPKKRNEVFVPEPVYQSDKDGKEKVFVRRPHIHDFVSASSADYDGVRRRLVEASNGQEVTIALSADAHSKHRAIIERYVTELKRVALREGLFADTVFYDHGTVDQLLNGNPELAEQYDVVELPAYPSHRLRQLSEYEITAVSKYRDSEGQPPTHAHEYVVLASSTPVKRPNLDSLKAEKDIKVFCLSRKKSAGFAWPFVRLSQTLTLNEASVEEVNESDILKRVAESSNHVGFLPYFTWKRLCDTSRKPSEESTDYAQCVVHLGKGEVTVWRLELEPDRVPNAMLLTKELSSFHQALKNALNAANKTFKSTEVGFQGYATAVVEPSDLLANKEEQLSTHLHGSKGEKPPISFRYLWPFAIAILVCASMLGYFYHQWTNSTTRANSVLSEVRVNLRHLCPDLLKLAKEGKPDEQLSLEHEDLDELRESYDLVLYNIARLAQSGNIKFSGDPTTGTREIEALSTAAANQASVINEVITKHHSDLVEMDSVANLLIEKLHRLAKLRCKLADFEGKLHHTKRKVLDLADKQQREALASLCKSRPMGARFTAVASDASTMHQITEIELSISKHRDKMSILRSYIERTGLKPFVLSDHELPTDTLTGPSTTYEEIVGIVVQGGKKTTGLLRWWQEFLSLAKWLIDFISKTGP